MKITALSSGTHDVRIGGLVQRFHVHGQGPLCIAHSGGPGIDWRYLRAPLLERSMQILYLEPIGTGDSGRLADPDGYAVPSYARWIRDLMDTLAIPRAHVLGHSHGGFVAQRFALDFPERTQALVLYSTSPRTGADFMAAAGEAADRFVIRDGNSERARRARRALDEVWTAPDDETLTRLLQALFPLYFADYFGREPEFEQLRNGVRAWCAPSRGRHPQFDITGELERIDIPALVVTGAHDFICGPRWTNLLSEALPRRDSLLLEHSGHFAHLEEPELFASGVIDFIMRTQRQAA